MLLCRYGYRRVTIPACHGGSISRGKGGAQAKHRPDGWQFGMKSLRFFVDFEFFSINVKWLTDFTARIPLKSLHL
jgi:hypothetical protein